uniref:Uncharacterized protein n=1 Tax=Lactuca sativa TaxID=4236 RepID=A0A9R1W538_LACSA|nr:hypothetical protein LSAT_V11C300122580 [Lactuca sativa]
MRTSWTDLNPDRRFFACSKEVDTPLCPRSTALIPRLLRTINRHELDLGNMQLYCDALDMFAYNSLSPVGMSGYELPHRCFKLWDGGGFSTIPQMFLVLCSPP